MKLQKYNLIFVHLLRNASGNHRDVQSGHLVSKSIIRLFGKVDFRGGLLLTSSRGQPGGKSGIGSSNCESRKLGWSWNLRHFYLVQGGCIVDKDGAHAKWWVACFV